jgi:cytochrome c biogenesis protein CcdA
VSAYFLSESINRLLSGGSFVAVPVVAAVGFVSTLRNPCAVPLYPAATGVCVAKASSLSANGDLPTGKPRTSLVNAAAFVIGMAMSIAVLGVGAAAAGRVIGIGRWGGYLIALLPLLMGVQRLGWVRIPFLEFKLTKTLRPSLAGAFGTGFLLSLVVGRCGGTVLATVLAYAAYHRAFVYGGVLLFAYGIGAGVPLVTFGAAVGKMTEWIDRKGYQKGMDYVMAAMMLALGFYLLWLA